MFARGIEFGMIWANLMEFTGSADSSLNTARVSEMESDLYFPSHAQHTGGVRRTKKPSHAAADPWQRVPFWGSKDVRDHACPLSHRPETIHN